MVRRSAGSVRRACDSISGREFESHLGYRVYIKYKIKGARWYKKYLHQAMVR